jgi:cation:H+ antiporter
MMFTESLESLPDFILIIIGFTFLIAGGEGVVQGAVTFAQRLNVPPLLIGFTIVAIGTSLPELAVALQAVSSGEQELVDLAVGGILGSNVANIMLVLGTAALLGACKDPGTGIRQDAMAVIVATIVLLLTVYIGEIYQIVGIGMVIGLVSYYTYSYKKSMAAGIDVELEDTWVPDNLFFSLVVLIMAGATIFLGSDLLITGATGMATSMGIKQSIIGLSVIALGTSLPELTVTIIAATRGQEGVAIGNVLGSNVINILGILGIASTYAGGIIVAPEFFVRDIWVVVITSGFVAAMLLDERHIGRRVGASMITGYLIYMWYLLG